MVHDYKKYPELTNKQLDIEGFMSPHRQITEDFEAEVVKVHDGDTITLRANFRDFDFPLRFLGIDAPELNAGGEKAREWLKGRILGQKVNIIIDRAQRVGKYGRLLGRVIHSGLDVGEEELMLGLAQRFEQRREGAIPDLNKTFALNQWF